VNDNLDNFQDEIQVKLESIVFIGPEESKVLERIENSPLHKILNEWKEKNRKYINLCIK